MTSVNSDSSRNNKNHLNSKRRNFESTDISALASKKHCQEGLEAERSSDLEEVADDERSLFERLQLKKKGLKGCKSSLTPNLLDHKVQVESEPEKNPCQSENETEKGDIADIEPEKEVPSGLEDVIMKSKTGKEIKNKKQPCPVPSKPLKKSKKELNLQVVTDPNNITWNNIFCIVCTEEIKCTIEKPNDNREEVTFQNIQC